MNAGQRWDAPYKPGDLVVVFKYGHSREASTGLITKCEMPPPGSLQIPMTEVLVNGEVITISFQEVRHLTQAETELADGHYEKLLDNEELNRRDDEALMNMPGIGELAYPIGEHINYHSAPMLVVEQRTVKEMDLESEDTEQAFFVDNSHCITWFDELPDETPLLKVVSDGQFFWIPGMWTTRIPNE